jgi:hypothetical protein
MLRMFVKNISLKGLGEIGNGWLLSADVKKSI